MNANSTSAWTVQAVRDLFLVHGEKRGTTGALVLDRGSQLTRTFDEVFRTEGIHVLKTPVRTPVANTFAERWIGTLRCELLDRTLIWNQRQLHRLATEYVERSNAHRPPGA